jgi:hypothetical protein
MVVPADGKGDVSFYLWMFYEEEAPCRAIA